MMIRANQASRRQQSSRIVAYATIARLALFVLVCLSSAGAALALDERIIFDPYNGLSLGGYDPVAYFTDREARMGSDEFEVKVGDTYWHFVSAANASAFESEPAAFIPGFGGYSVGAVARGVPQPGSPKLFAIFHNRLYLFATTQERGLFLADPAKAIAAAEEHWPDVLKLLAY